MSDAGKEKPSVWIQFLSALGVGGICVAAITVFGQIIVAKIENPSPTSHPVVNITLPSTMPKLLTPTPTLTVTFPLTNTPTSTSTPTSTETPTPAPTITETSTPTATLGIVCPWLPFSTLNPSITIGQNCLNDLLNLGLSQTDQKILFYRESGMNIGVLGISQNVETGNEFSITVSIKTLKAVRFLTLLSQRERGYASSIGFRILREGNKKSIQLVRYDSSGFDTVVSDINELDLWDGKLKLTLKFNGPQVRAYVNNAYFGQTQIDFSERYLFLGYQVMSGGASQPHIDLSVDWP
jgi:hypothetical protein